MPYKSIDLARLSSIGIGPVAEVYMIDGDDYPTDAYLIGAANNVLFGTELPPLMKLSKTYDFIRIETGILHIGAATPGGKVVSFCKKHNIGGFEFLAHLPGTLGGMLKMNAGLKEYEIFNHLIALRTKSGWHAKAEVPHGYRTTGIDEVVFEAMFEIAPGFDPSKIELFRQMRANQPSDPSAGSAFKNPPGDYAGRLIESVGLKGYHIGDMAFSTMHANFLVNLGSGTFEEAATLLELAQRRVQEREGILLEREVIVIDRRWL
ncbi:UDP-N-acetylmuramate dehydrogenase [Sulfurimonas sp. HSL-3221]|uniref:UDP-N-acetylmuramate dehydrogenase n=1 Tax=Sulfurimonadaceae TaxID=2771471 RepID=UPI001E47DD62|nr:UDP-N-acetylmuramate dehydrogenase [Sulfurimonas sp. HSL-3221]UFS62694.1 UDP-N-acetylmuramate dehydrogenase [Sulfurimonas sp. HSL-3221]